MENISSTIINQLIQNVTNNVTSISDLMNTMKTELIVALVSIILLVLFKLKSIIMKMLGIQHTEVITDGDVTTRTTRTRSISQVAHNIFAHKKKDRKKSDQYNDSDYIKKSLNNTSTNSTCIEYETPMTPPTSVECIKRQSTDI